MLKISQLHFQRNQRLILQDLSLTLYAGQGAVIYGVNGSGKTTLIKIIANIIPIPQPEQILWYQEPIMQSEQIRIGYLGHQNGLKGFLTVLENLSIAKLFMKNIRNGFMKKADEVLEYWGLHREQKHLTQFLSAGQQRRLALARLEMLGANLWLLDEPLSALDSQAIELFYQQVSSFLKRGGILIMSSHTNIRLSGVDEFMLYNGGLRPSN
ncbi:MAG: heme ABC exporter ATP-binding protein CcmA [Alphaproteobacteria bacterium]|nr:heme ABC exporter ATP-binding protein CcmA [Alphaproteobacteria bacterium]